MSLTVLTYCRHWHWYVWVIIFLLNVASMHVVLAFKMILCFFFSFLFSRMCAPLQPWRKSPCILQKGLWIDLVVPNLVLFFKRVLFKVVFKWHPKTISLLRSLIAEIRRDQSLNIWWFGFDIQGLLSILYLNMFFFFFFFLFYASYRNFWCCAEFLAGD